MKNKQLKIINDVIFGKKDHVRHKKRLQAIVYIEKFKKVIRHTLTF